jgi:hypothetical protein
LEIQLSRKLKLFLSSLFLVGWLFLIGPNAAQADDNAQMAVSQATSPIIDTATIVAQVISDANTQISQAEATQSHTETSMQAISNMTDTITATVQAGEDSIVLARSIVDSATVAIALQETATITANNAVNEKNIALANLETSTATLQLKTTAFNIAKSAVDSQTIVVNTETLELTALQNTPSNSVTYTTSGYVAPQIIDTNVVSTVILPPMGDASTKITTPFDIKLGETMYEGQGANSQLYVTSKSALTFGAGDHTYWDWPQIAGLYIFQSDYMSSGPGASITVTTTSNTLAISWDLHRFGDNNGPITNTDLFMIVNTDSGEWTATASISGNTSGLYGGPRTGVRPVTGQAVQSMTALGNTDLQSQIAAQQVVVQQETTKLNNLTVIKNTALSEKTLAVQAVDSETVTYNSKNTMATNAVFNLTSATNAMNQAVALIAPAISNMNAAVSAAQSVVQNKIAEEDAIRQAAIQAEAERQVAIAAANAAAAYQAQLQAQAEAQAAAEAAAKAEADRIAAEQAAAAQAEQDRLAEEAAAQAEAEAKAQEEADAKAEAEAKKAEEAAQQAEEEAQKVEQDAIDKAIEDALDGKELTEEQKELVAEALLEDANGEAISAEDIKEAGLDYKDLPADTPVDVRTDSNGNAVIITAEVAANLELVQNPGELLATAFSDPKAALAALGSLGADMSPQEREKAEDMVVATVVATGAAINAIGMASSPSAPTGGGSSGGSSGGANSGGSRRRNERW